MKLKYYLRGLGIGMILTTLILTISGNGRKLSDDQIINRAMQLGMILKEDPKGNLDNVIDAKDKTEPDKNTKEPEISSNEDSEDIQNEDSETKTDYEGEGSKEPVEATNKPIDTTEKPVDNSDETVVAQNEPVVAPDEPIVAPDEPIVAPNETVETEPSGNEGSVSESITFTIEKGMSSGMVSLLLEEKGLVESSDEFNQFIIQKKKASVIMIGKFTLPKGASFQKILDTITNNQ